ncbi:MAG: preprotein translocase subunit YajC [Oscillospiraceae bacterium]|nr:preprotein translocase subunit YajC [Oscillospiraceae bacterium]
MNGNYFTIIYLVVIIAVFYFLLILPEKNRKKAAQQMRDSLKVGDEITTIGGIIGSIVELTDDTVVIETIEDRVRVQFARWAISSVGKQTNAQ